MAHGQRRRPLAGLAIALASTLWLGVLAPSPAAASSVSLRRGMYSETNSSRQDHHKLALKLNARMSKKALRHSRAMARAGELFHTSDPARFYLHGIHWSAWGENVGETTGSVSDLERAFMHSPPHKANILNGAFRHVAIGAVQRDGYLWVTVFFYGT